MITIILSIYIQVSFFIVVILLFLHLELDNVAVLQTQSSVRVFWIVDNNLLLGGEEALAAVAADVVEVDEGECEQNCQG